LATRSSKASASAAARPTCSALCRNCWHIRSGRLQPETIIPHRLPLEQAAEGYRIFDKKEDNCRKVILRPGA